MSVLSRSLVSYDTVLGGLSMVFFNGGIDSPGESFDPRLLRAGRAGFLTLKLLCQNQKIIATFAATNRVKPTYPMVFSLLSSRIRFSSLKPGPDIHPALRHDILRNRCRSRPSNSI
jgi:hypothetical protein